MSKFSRVLTEAIKSSGMNFKEYAADWDVPPRTVRHWLDGTPPSSKYTSKIEERFPAADYPGLFEEEVVSGPAFGNGLWSPEKIKIMLARMSVINLTFVFEWLVLKASAKERDKFRQELGSDWEWFMNLSRSLVNEKSREVMQSEGRLNPTSRRGL